MDSTSDLSTFSEIVETIICEMFNCFFVNEKEKNGRKNEERLETPVAWKFVKWQPTTSRA
jgi:hypothetical protein